MRDITDAGIYIITALLRRPKSDHFTNPKFWSQYSDENMILSFLCIDIVHVVPQIQALSSHFSWEEHARVQAENKHCYQLYKCSHHPLIKKFVIFSKMFDLTIVPFNYATSIWRILSTFTRFGAQRSGFNARLWQNLFQAIFAPTVE